MNPLTCESMSMCSTFCVAMVMSLPCEFCIPLRLLMFTFLYDQVFISFLEPDSFIEIEGKTPIFLQKKYVYLN